MYKRRKFTNYMIKMAHRKSLLRIPKYFDKLFLELDLKYQF